MNLRRIVTRSLAILVPWTTVSRNLGPLVRVTLDHGFVHLWTTRSRHFGPRFRATLDHLLLYLWTRLFESVPLLSLASLFTHGFSFDLDRDRVMDNAVHDGISDRSLSKTLVPLRDG